MKGFKGFQNFTQKAVTYLIVVLFLLMFGITNLNVFTRYFLNKPISFSVAMVSVGTLVAVMVSARATGIAMSAAKAAPLTLSPCPQQKSHAD